MGLTLDPLQHRYWLDGREFPSITTVLQDCGMTTSKWFGDDSQYRNRGTAVHELCADIATLERPDSTCVWDGTCTCGAVGECRHTVAFPYARSFEQWVRRAGFVVEPGMIELRVWSATLQCAGTLDLWGHAGRHRVLVDLKSGQPQNGAALQLAAYRWMARECMDVETDESYCLWLDRDGGFPKVVQPKNPAADERIFQSLMEVWWWRRAHGMLPWKEKL